MSQVGEAHKMMMRHLDWAAAKLAELALLLPQDPEQDAAFVLDQAVLQLENARRLAEQIDSGTVYALGDEAG